ncbi:MAG: threonine synthase [Gudongella sp.]|nr:threonine synthase [Gudongella sp.]
MNYRSTRDNTINISSMDAIIKGISDEGGLFVPKSLPKFGNMEAFIGSPFSDIAYKVLSCFLTDYSEAELKFAVKNAYDDKFSSRDIVNIKKTNDAFFLELFHGPTSAFKDIALQIMPHLLQIALRNKEIKEKIVILVATSGDTGKAALEGFKDIEGIEVVVLYPNKGVSDIQRAQMQTQTGDNLHVIAINGNFDDAQNEVKNIFSDKKYNKELLDKGFRLSSANSINIGRLIPQITYYFYGYLKMLENGEIEKDEKINVVVPTGNFGNILAAYYAKEMGLPVNHFICASNDNNVLTDFFNQGEYNRNRELLLTSSPSMDILISSNLERFIYHILGEDERLVNQKMKELKENGKYCMDKISDELISGEYINEKEVSFWIGKVYKEENYVMDPHTAVAYGAYQKYIQRTKDQHKTLIASTASPYKFPKKVLNSMGIKVPDNDFLAMEVLEKNSLAKFPKKLRELKELPIIHDIVVEKNDIKKTIEELLEGRNSCDSN